jgi:hypothetical protein
MATLTLEKAIEELSQKPLVFPSLEDVDFKEYFNRNREGMVKVCVWYCDGIPEEDPIKMIGFTPKNTHYPEPEESDFIFLDVPKKIVDVVRILESPNHTSPDRYFLFLEPAENEVKGYLMSGPSRQVTKAYAKKCWEETEALFSTT